MYFQDKGNHLSFDTEILVQRRVLGSIRSLPTIKSGNYNYAVAGICQLSHALKIIGKNDRKLGDKMPLDDLFEELQKCNNITIWAYKGLFVYKGLSCDV